MLNNYLYDFLSHRIFCKDRYCLNNYEKVFVINTEIQKKIGTLACTLLDIPLWVSGIKTFFINLIQIYYVRKISELSGRRII